MLRDFKAPYSAFESFLYDWLVAPGVVDMKDAVAAPFLERVPKGAEVLEVGCGGGQLAIEIARERPDLRYVGLDLSHEQVARADKRGARLAPRLSFVQGSALELPYEDGRFGVVLSVASIKHWPDPARGLSECVRVLAPGGLLVVVEADRSCKLDDAWRFMTHLHLLPPFRPLALMLFRTFVAGRSLDLDDARALVADLPLARCEVRRVPGTPALIIDATRA
jgi:SAM-dependent methyltransferase